MSLTLALYQRLMGLAHGLAPQVLQNRVTRGKEDAERYAERLGLTHMPRPEGSLVWFHGVSVGESLSILPIIALMAQKRPDLKVLVTTATTTSADILAKRLPDGAIHQYAPVDTPQALTAFLDHWKPDLAVFIESDIWPNQLRELTRRRIPHVLLSARITAKTYRGWRRFKSSVSSLLKGYSLIMAQD
ncbi:MAG: glycosyltransferase N-terminal domain-containing protein, partial [Asticcacaulis sp.]